MISRHEIKYLFDVYEANKPVVPGSVVFHGLDSRSRRHGLDNRNRGIVISVKNEFAVVLWSIESIMTLA